MAGFIGQQQGTMSRLTKEVLDLKGRVDAAPHHNHPPMPPPPPLPEHSMPANTFTHPPVMEVPAIDRLQDLASLTDAQGWAGLICMGGAERLINDMVGEETQP